MVTKNLKKNVKSSSSKLKKFLEKTGLHKKDFAQMIGVTLSYVYNLLDETLPFSSRSTTIERIAAVMEINPEEFIEYKIPQEPLFIDDTVEFLKEKQHEKGISMVCFLKSFPRKKRVEIVDIFRGATPMPLDWNELRNIGNILSVSAEELYPYWEKRILQTLNTAGMNVRENEEIVDAMLNCAKTKILETK
ncbi:MAG: helix-turn-helix domain-containing protein [Candidatus Gastranaerophilaceae bacterium]